MSNRKIIQLMQVLGRFDTGFEEFEAYLLLPASDTTLQLRSLFAYFEKYFGRYNAANLNPKKIFREIYQEGAVYKSRKVSEPIRQLTALLDDFLPSFAARVDPELRSEIRRRLYHKNHKEALFYEEISQKEKTSIELHGSKSVMEELGILHDAYYFFPESKTEKELTQYLDDHLFINEMHYEINRLKSSCNRLNRAIQYAHTLPKGFKDDLDEFIGGLRGKGNCLVKILIFAAEFYLEPSTERYYIFKESFLKYLDKLPEDRFDLLHLLINGVSFVNLPDGRLSEYFYLYNLGIENDILAKNHFIPTQLYINVLHTAINLGKGEWAKKFNDDYYKLLSRKNDLELKIIEGYLAYSAGEFQKVVFLLKKQHFRATDLALRKYFLLIKSLYAMKGKDEFTYLLDVIKNFKELLRRHFKEGKITNPNYSRILNFLVILSLMAKQNLTKEELTEKMESFGAEIVESKWLRDNLF